ncbi:Phage major capsid protein [Arthrobacter sp. 9AX]|uniref:phage major capsid protein n=1 Tax=Arthrobacter sp. 9AX TaxID=2653131 RepID=UPI0012F3E93F|nr:phage major capsid protein [Arthrobacter sp. 9AX]VXC38683.1 Phage major capsid protein [Arthrobacter sp. 9AX]
MPTPREQLATLNREADDIIAKAEAGTLSEAGAARATELVKERKAVQAVIASQDAAKSALDGMQGIGSTVGGPGADNSVGGLGRSGQAAKAAKFAGGMLKALEQAAPLVGGPALKKALVPTGAVTAPFLNGETIIHDPGAAHHLLSAVGSLPVETPSGSYLRQTVRTNNADTVVNGALKPESVYELEPVTWEIATIAHVSEPVQLQWLADYAGLENFLAVEMSYGVDSAVSDFILNGGTSENGNPVSGILTTTGIAQTAFTTNKLLSIRRALGQLETAGVAATGIVLNPADWEEIETMLDGEGRFLLPQAPGQAVARTLWNVPVTLVPGIPAGQAVVGDLTTITLLYRNSLQLAWNPYHANTGTEAAPETVDLFRRNQAVFRAEVRVGLEITSLKTLRVVDLTA